MHNFGWVLGSTCLFGLLSHVSAVHAAPDWCKDSSQIEQASKPNVSDYDWKSFDEDDPRRVIQIFVGAYCFPNDDAKRDHKIVDAAFKKWSAKLDMTDADWADAVTYVSFRYGGEMKVENTKVSWTKWSPADQYIGIQKSDIGFAGSTIDQTYLVDALDAAGKLTALGRAAYVQHCVHSKAEAYWAMCQADVDAIDRKAIAADLRADTTHNGWQKMMIRMELLKLYGDVNDHAADVKKLKDKDPGYAKMFDVAANARKDFTSKANPKLLEAVMLMDDARVTNSRKASDGCMAKTLPAFQAYVSSLPAKTFNGIIHDPMKQPTSPLSQALGMVVDTPNGYLASLALYYCSKFEKEQDYLARMLGIQLASWPGFRGSRNAVHTAIRLANIQLDDRDARIDYPSVQRSIGENGSSSGGGSGAIAKVTEKGDTTVIEFAKVKTQQQDCVKGHSTHRIRQIQSDGTLIYEYICEKWTTTTFNEPPFPPQTVKTVYAKGLKKGMFVHVVENVVTIAYPKNGASVPVMIAGAAVK